MSEGAEALVLDDLDRRVINRLQDGLPVCDRPFADVAAELGLSEQALIDRVRRLLDAGILSRFGPMYNADAMGGAFSLVAMAVPEEDFDRVAGIVNGFAEVAHNYQRDHALNMWFVVATETRERAAAVLREIEVATGLPVHDMPKLREFHVRLRLEA